MASRKYIAYYRVSTVKQGQSGLGLDAQQAAVMSYLNGGNWVLTKEFTEVESGKRNDRPQLAAALAACKLYKATLVIAKLDRLARNVHFISGLMDSGVEFVAVDMPYANRLTLHIMAAMAEHEAAMISTRTKAALQAAKARGTKLGGNRGHLSPATRRKAHANSLATRQKAASERLAQVQPIVEQARSLGYSSLRAIADYLNQQGVPTARGKKWSPMQIGRLK